MYAVSKRASGTTPFMVMEILEKAQMMQKSGEDVIHLEVGEPDFDTPACVKDAAIKAIGEGKTKYTHSMGLPELREEISLYYKREYNVEVSPEQVIVTSGTSPAMLLIFAAVLESSDEVIMSNPYYACYPNFIRFFNANPRFVELSGSEGFACKPGKINEKISGKTKAVLVNSPSNPTGMVIEKETLKEISESDAVIVSDEIYHGLTYEGKAHSILEFTDDAFVLNGFSKKYAMTGWRLGYLIAPEEFIRPMQKIAQSFLISTCEFVQWAGISALRCADGDVENMVRVYDKRRRFMVKRLQKIGFGVQKTPGGAFYVLADAREFGDDSFKLALEILDNTKVAVTPGIDFGSAAEGHIRFSYANSLERIAEGMSRLEEFLK
ncbi:MAG: aspartate aminotransferase [Candidatus Altiarchaeales archaeon WOR_SM1_79]|nr:MAG: aspartate aminotransferase [Candidatus Altiarchaeales archaeon WOR_SM1_79]